MNVGTKTVLVGAGMYGVRKAWEWSQEKDNDEAAEVVEQPVAFSKSMLGQAGCATVSGWFQVYSGGIAIDTVATRLQAGQPINQAMWGLSRPKTDTGALIKRFGNISGMNALKVRIQLPRLLLPEHAKQIRTGMLLRSNLYAGHFVTMISRFPYLFLNFNTYEQVVSS